MATQTVEQVTRLPEFQEQYLANLLTSAQGLFKPTDEGGLGLTMPYAPAQQAALQEAQQKQSKLQCRVGCLPAVLAASAGWPDRRDANRCRRWYGPDCISAVHGPLP